MPTVMNDAIELYYETFGIQDDPVVVCLPGMGNQLLIFPEAFCMALVDRGFYVIRMDNRDAGLSSITADDDEYTLSDMADDVVAVLDDVGVGTAVVLGLSLGGMIAQQLAVDHPDRVRALVSLASTTGELDLPAASDEVVAALTAPSKATVEEQIEAGLRVVLACDFSPEPAAAVEHRPRLFMRILSALIDWAAPRPSGGESVIR